MSSNFDIPPIITDTIDELTIAKWMERFPTTPFLHANRVKAFRTDAEKQADLDYHTALFEKVGLDKLTCCIIYLAQVMKARDPRGTIYLLEELADIINTEQMLADMPPALRSILEGLAKKMEN